MRAVNLIPPDRRRAASGGLGALSAPTRALFAALVLALALGGAFAVLANGVADRQAVLAERNAAVRAEQARGAALAPFGEVSALRQRSAETVRGLAQARFDWAGLLADLARRVPADVTLATLEGSVADPATAAAAAPPAAAAPAAPAAPAAASPAAPAGAAPAAPAVGAAVAGSAAAPAIELSGCAADHGGVARTMEALQAAPRVADVALASSDAEAGAADAACPRPAQFRMTLVLAASAPAPRTGGAP